MDVFISDFNKKLNSELTVNQVPDPAEAFDKAFDKAIDAFNNQTLRVDLEMLPMIIFMSLFIGVHSFIMIFAGTRKKYSYKELEEVGRTISVRIVARLLKKESNNLINVTARHRAVTFFYSSIIHLTINLNVK